MHRIKGVNTALHKAISLMNTRNAKSICIYHGTIFFEYEVDDIGLQCFKDANQPFQVVQNSD